MRRTACWRAASIWPMPPRRYRANLDCHAARPIAISKRRRRSAIQFPITEPSVPITFKIPGSVVRDLRSYSAASGLTLGEIVARAISTFLKATRRHG